MSVPDYDEVHKGDGGATVGPHHGSRYTHPVILTMSPAVSDGLAHPFPTFALGVGVGVNVGPVSVGTAPVGV